MTQLRLIPTTFAASAVLLLAVLAPRPASALLAAPPACSVNSDCEKGFECTVVATSGCASSGAAPACPPGESCEAPAPEPPSPCVTEEQRACTPAQCATNADCAAGMVCHAYQVPCAVTNCACPPDAGDCNCGPQVCNPETVSMCTPRYALPCTEAADCGEGFACEQQPSTCGCGGGAEPTPDPGGAGFAPLPPDGAGGAAPDDKVPPSDPLPQPECPPCEPSGVFACVAQEILCDDASDCPTGWICQQEVQASEPGCAGPDCPEPKPAPLLPARRLCQPEYYGGGVGVDNGGSGTPTTGTPGSAPTPEANPNSPSAEEGDANESAACQMGHAPASSGALSLLAVLGALLGLKRRRT